LIFCKNSSIVKLCSNYYKKFKIQISIILIMPQNDIEKTRIKLRTKLDRPVFALLHSKGWRALWDYCEKHNINYYWEVAFGRLAQKFKKFKFKDYDLYGIGQSHLDLCWLWTKLSTVRRGIITSQQSIEYFEKYPHYTFSQTQPQIYEWIQKIRPKLFQKIKEYEEKGKWEIVGGMWVEPDTNVPGGEALVRQRLLGQLYFLENFGKIATIECLEDTFGFNAQLPQILKKSGAEAFWTTKITWNEYSEFPFANFIWRGLDGSEIFTHMYKFMVGAMTELKLYNRTGKKMKEPGLVFNSSYTLKEINDHKSHERIRSCGIFYGFGDGGMGPLQEEIDIMTNVARSGHLKFTTTRQFFDILKKECGNSIPIWDDELYLELHRGCYTSQAKMKMLNRRGEINLRDCELFLTLFALFFKYFKYPSAKMKRLWKDLLFNQFHDILPGSSIQDVYYQQEKELENVVKKTSDYIHVALQFTLLTYLKRKNQSENAKDYLIVLNTLPWTRDARIDCEDIKYDRCERKGDYIVIKDIAPISFHIINLKEYFEELNKENEKPQSDLILEYLKDEIIIENSKLSLVIDKITGKITSLIFKETEREVIREKDGIGIRLFEERRYRYPAWEINRNFTSWPVSLGMVKAIKIETDTNQTKTIKLIYRLKKTTIYHFITLKADSDMVEFRTEIEAWSKKILFKVRFPFNLDTNLMSCEIPYGYKERKIMPSSEMEEGKWEFPAQKYVDISEPDFGITLVNNSKYGFSKNEKGLYLTLLHTPKLPYSPFFSYIKTVPKSERVKYVDFGSHVIEYAIWFHNNDFKESAAWRKGYEYNYPLHIKEYDEDLQSGSEFFDIEINEKFINIFSQTMSMVSVSNQNVILEVIKFPEDYTPDLEKSRENSEEKSISLILRLYETSGGPQDNVEIEFNNVFKIDGAIETDLLERPLNGDDTTTISIKDRRKLLVNFGKFEIKTIKLNLSL